MRDYILALLVFLMSGVAGVIGFTLGYWIGYDKGVLATDRRWWRDRAQ